MNIQLKPMRLTFSREGDTWNKVITDLDGNIIFEQLGLKLFEEQISKQYFDDWENQLVNAPWWNIVEVVRFI